MKYKEKAIDHANSVAKGTGEINFHYIAENSFIAGYEEAMKDANIMPKGYKVYVCTDCKTINVKHDNGEITVGFCDNCEHPLWN